MMTKLQNSQKENKLKENLIEVILKKEESNQKDSVGVGEANKQNNIIIFV